jgi:glycosyltransferase involved in cell wall biosynthesis
VSEKTLVAFAEVAWGYFRTRKQFLLARLARRGWRVVYLEPLAAGRGNAWRPRDEDGVNVVTVPFLKTNTKSAPYNAAIAFPWARALLEDAGARAARRAMAMAGVTSPDVAFVSNIYAAKALSASGARLVCYDFNDHPLQFAAVPAWAEGYLERALARADVVIAVSPHYERQLRARVTAPVVRIGNGVEYERFASATNPPAAPSGAAWAKIGRPRAGYVGKVSHFLDFETLGRLARQGGFELVVLGPLPEETARSVERLRGEPHAHVLGEVPYDDLPTVLRQLDLALIPFRAGDRFTVGINPNKLYQYWAAGLGIVSSPISDVAEDGRTLTFADTPEAFERAVVARLAEPRDEAAARARARAHDWDAIAERLDGLLVAALEAKAKRGRVAMDDVARFGEDRSTT